MAFDALDEHEQGELVRKWLRENAMSILIGVVLGLLIIFGWQQWRTHRARHGAEAALHYQSLATAFEAKNTDAATATLEGLKKDYADSAYAVFAAMRTARDALARADKPAAVTAAEWAYEHAASPELKALAGLRLARLRLGEGQGDQALALLQQLPSAGYEAMIAELRGDALLAAGKTDEARAAYQQAFDALDAASPARQNLEMKLADLGGSTEKKSS